MAKSLFVATLVLFASFHVQSASLHPNKVQPFAQPEPVTISAKAAVKFKPQLKLSEVCHPYPAVDTNGNISAGMKAGPGSTSLDDCGGSPLGEQIYARSVWHNDVWAIMYAWYFPKGVDFGGEGLANVWEYVIIWLDNPALKTPTIRGVTLKSGLEEIEKHSPVDAKYIDGSSFKCLYKYKTWGGKTALSATSKKGGYQDLITWDQVSDPARTAINNSAVWMPMTDVLFEKVLNAGWPF